MKVLLEVSLFTSCLLLPYLLFWGALREKFRIFFAVRPGVTLTIFFALSGLPIAYDLLYNRLSVPQVSLRLAYLLAAIFTAAMRKKYAASERARRVVDIFLFLLIWLPIELDLLPGGSWAISSGINLATIVLGAIQLFFFIYIVFMPIPDARLGLTLSVGRTSFGLLFVYLTALALLLIPAGLLLNFLSIKTPIDFWPLVFLRIAGFLILVAIPEEMLFRGIFINAIRQESSGNTAVLLILSSLIFGSAHILNATPNWPAPNWVYFGFSTVAGFFYGLLYLKSGSLFAAALLHAAVDGIWTHFLKM